MIHIRNIPDTDALTDNPELYREVSAYLMYCQMELQEYADEDDPEDQDFNFMVLSKEDLPMLNDMLANLGSPEETVQINIKSDGMVLTMFRIVYPTEVLFIPAAISDQFSF